jgi:CheY-like chemotaxis protein
MAKIVCFCDTTAITYAVQQGFIDSGHDLHLLSASSLTNKTREKMYQLAPDIILLELTAAPDNAHLYFFLRSDQYTRDIPVILLSNNVRLQQQAAILAADGYLQRPFGNEQLWDVIIGNLPRQHALAAA